MLAARITQAVAISGLSLLIDTSEMFRMNNARALFALPKSRAAGEFLLQRALLHCLPLHSDSGCANPSKRGQDMGKQLFSGHRSDHPVPACLRPPTLFPLVRLHYVSSAVHYIDDTLIVPHLSSSIVGSMTRRPTSNS